MVTPLELLLIPGALVVLAAILMGTAWLEDSFLSPRSLIAYTVRSRSRRITADDVERLVALQTEALLRDRNFGRREHF